jgi:hypothetical protein
MRIFSPGSPAVAIVDFVHDGTAYKRGDAFPPALTMHQTQLGGLWSARLIDFGQPAATATAAPAPAAKPAAPQQHHRR